MAADGFADWEDSFDGAPEDETLEEALAEERTLELESETLSAFPISVQLVPLVYHSQKIGFCPGCFLQPPQSLCANFPFEPLLAVGRGFFLLVLQLGVVVSGVLVLLQLAFQLQRAFGEVKLSWSHGRMNCCGMMIFPRRKKIPRSK